MEFFTQKSLILLTYAMLKTSISDTKSCFVSNNDEKLEQICVYIVFIKNRFRKSNFRTRIPYLNIFNKKTYFCFVQKILWNIERDSGLSNLCHSCGFVCQQRVLKGSILSSCYLVSVDEVVWLWSSLELLLNKMCF